MDNMELHFRKMPTERLVQEVKILEKELKTARKTLKTRRDPEQTAWICTVCKDVMAAKVDTVVKHIRSAHNYPETHAIINTDEIYL